MKKAKILFICLLAIFICSISDTVSSAETNRKTDIGIGFDKNKGTTKPIKPTVYEPAIKPDVTSLLPQTNEMIQSLIVILIGVTFLLVFIGMYIIKQTYNYKKEYI